MCHGHVEEWSSTDCHVEEGKYLRSGLRDNLKLISDGDEVGLRCDVSKFAKNPIELSVWNLPFRHWSA